MTFKFYPSYRRLLNGGAGSGPPSPRDYAIPGNVGQDVVDVINDIAHCSKGNAATPTALRQLRPRMAER